jgi:hypothetical protein
MIIRSGVDIGAPRALRGSNLLSSSIKTFSCKSKTAANYNQIRLAPGDQTIVIGWKETAAG